MSAAGVRLLASRGHRVLVETGAGEGSGIADADYVAQGATIVAHAADAWGAELVVKVKEPLDVEYDFLRKGLVLYTYLHLAAAPELTQRLVASGTTAVRPSRGEPGGRKATWPSDAPDASRKMSIPPAAAIRSS